MVLMCSSTSVLGGFCVVMSGLLLLPYSHKNTFLANGRAKHSRLLCEMQTENTKYKYMFSFLASYTLKL
jgi:hypothetical protein